MNSVIRHYTKEDYKTLITWYEGWNLPITPEEYIPEHALIVNEVCIGFLYQLGNTSMYWIEGIISNPESTKEEKSKAVNVLIRYLTEMARDNGATMILSSTPRQGLKNMFNDNEFGTAPEQYYHVARRL